MRIFLIGFMGCGKSYTGRRLSQLIGVPFIDLDDHITQRAGQSIAQMFAGRGEAYFRQQESAALDELLALPTYVMATGGGTPCHHDGIERLNAAGTTIFIDPSLPLLTERLERGRDKRPLLQTTLPLPVYVRGKLEERRPCYEKAHYHIEVDDPSTDVARLILELVSPQPHSRTL